MVPLLKPSKAPSVAGSYRTISLLCALSKILERLILNKVLVLLPICSFQQAFQSLLSITTLPHALSQSILESLINDGKLAPRYLDAAINVSKVFETFPCRKLVAKIIETQLP